MHKRDTIRTVNWRVFRLKIYRREKKITVTHDGILTFFGTVFNDDHGLLVLLRLVSETYLSQRLAVRRVKPVVFNQVQILIHALQVAPLLFVLRQHRVADQRHDLLRCVQLVLALHCDRVQLLFQRYLSLNRLHTHNRLGLPYFVRRRPQNKIEIHYVFWEKTFHHQPLHSYTTSY